MDYVPFGHEPYIRLGVFSGVFVAMAISELIAPRRPRTIGRRTRWPSNFGIVVVDTLLVRAVFPMSALGLALLADARGWGLFHLVELPTWIVLVASVVLLDLAIYLQHVLFHAVPALWRVHPVHTPRLS